MKKIIMPFTMAIVVIAVFFVWQGQKNLGLPSGNTTFLNMEENMIKEIEQKEEMENTSKESDSSSLSPSLSSRQILITDGVKHSIPINEILSGGPPKDGIPSIDNPDFISTLKVNQKLRDEDFGIGLKINSDVRFYPYRILVWHEIVNDTVGGKPVVVTYCPLCATGVIYDRTVDGVATEFGVSGKLWQSNLLMYNRGSEEDESLWSQVLGEAVLGKFTGTKLKIISSDIIEYGDWKKIYPNTKVLSEDTGISRNYGLDPYADYYTSPLVSFEAEFKDTRLDAKDFILGVELNGKFKAYKSQSIKVGVINDSIGEEKITIEKNSKGIIKMFDSNKIKIQYIGGFWFSWAAVHPETEVFK